MQRECDDRAQRHASELSYLRSFYERNQRETSVSVQVQTLAVKSIDRQV
jgi:hypothetical protein